ncbi:GbsR/MarR family transcriptional regulator [Streptomyces millisiae]|uniref:MarR family transcriptional regulator n=1 Tax=Streptomyces millisiae TaxID=3075542 RepID=A0ABU2M0K7_9ACTN|nr:MarR family transcriptional regulator [Streptomyces sp. DSM 44918]MDT0323372.1 MarR family transcriptional regulator [Streptomyces sp. DSM 44918]
MIEDGTTERHGEYTDAVAAFVERFAADLIQAGMPRMPSRVFACLMASQEATLSSAELSDRLRISPAAVSGAVRYLDQVHLLSREREPGSRRERYRVRHASWYEAMINRDAILRRWIDTMRAGLDVVGPGTAAADRLAEMTDFIEFLDSQLKGMLDRWHELRAAHATSADRRSGAPERP